MTDDPGPASLAALEGRLRRDLTLLNQPAAPWLERRTHPKLGPVLDVAIIGAGMAGLAVAFALIRQGVANIRLFDAAEAGAEGPWVTYARMVTLRSPKQLAGPALGLPNLTFRAWFEAQHGAEAWAALGRIPRGQWMDYLRWYRRMLNLPVENGCRLADLDHDGDLPVLTLDGPGGPRRVAARRVVLATGRDGLGGPSVPAVFRALPPELCAHAADPIDFSALAGRDVVVVGAGASAVDNAATALEAGAAGVTLLVRRPDIPRINKGMGVSNPGLAQGYYDLPPAARWAISAYVADCQVPPPRDSMLRCTRHPNFSIRLGAPVREARAEGDRAVLTTPGGEVTADFVILGTGFGVDWARRPELAKLSPAVRRWRDVYQPPGADAPDFADSPFLGPWFELEERVPGAAPWLGRVACFNYAATLSHYKLTGDIPAISTGAERLAEGLIRALFVEDRAAQHQRLVDYQTPEIRGDEWRPEQVVRA